MENSLILLPGEHSIYMIFITKVGLNLISLLSKAYGFVISFQYHLLLDKTGYVERITTLINNGFML